jgi:DNA-binding response OmpR family regulator
MNFQIKILVIEDDPRFAKTIRNVLSQHGYRQIDGKDQIE